MIRNQDLVVQKWENAIHWIVIYIADSMIKASSLLVKIYDEKKLNIICLIHCPVRKILLTTKQMLQMCGERYEDMIDHQLYTQHKQL